MSKDINIDCTIMAQTKFDPSNYNLLVIEDSKSVNKILTKTFIQQGFNCHSVFTLGDAKEKLLGKPHNIIRHPDMPSSVFEELWNTIKNEKKSWTGKVKNRKKDGTHYWAQAIIKPIVDANGNIIEFIGLRHDITEEEVKEYFKSKPQSSQKDLSTSIKLAKEYERAIADVFDALGSDRCYKKAWDDGKIFKLFEEERGEHFDPKLVDLFMQNKDLFFEVREKFKD